MSKQHCNICGKELDTHNMCPNGCNGINKKDMEREQKIAVIHDQLQQGLITHREYFDKFGGLVADWLHEEMQVDPSKRQIAIPYLIGTESKDYNLTFGEVIYNYCTDEHWSGNLADEAMVYITNRLGLSVNFNPGRNGENVRQLVIALQIGWRQMAKEPSFVAVK